MLGFKNYLNETHDGSNSVRMHIIEGSLPLTYPMMRRLGLIEEGVEAYRISSTNGFNRIIKQQNTKKQTSTFTKPDSNIVNNIYVNNDFVLKLKGTKVISGDTDIWTLLDPSGRRWLSFSDQSTTSGKRAIEEIREMTLKAYTKRFDNIMNMFKSDEIDLVKIGNKMALGMFLNDDYSTGRERNEMYKIFFTEVEKWLKSNASLVRKHIEEMKEKDSSTDYNEVVLTKFVIIGYYTFEGFTDSETEHKKSLIKGIKKFKDLGDITVSKIYKLKDLS